MKKILTLDTIFTALFTSIGYGIGFFIPSSHGYNYFVSLIVCMIIGTIFDMIINPIVFSRYIQEKNSRRYVSFIVIGVVFASAWYLSIKYLSHSLLGDIAIQYTFVLGIPFISIIVKILSLNIKQNRMIKKYGTGETGFYFNEEEIKNMNSLNDRNKEITGEYDKDNSVTLKQGTYVGSVKDKIIHFYGIPYAKAPINNLRFISPKDLEDSNKVFEAYYYGPSEIQPKSDHNILNNHIQSEDCLYMNVLTSSLDKNNLKPVLVYFHGGDYRYGGSASPLSSLENISRKFRDVVMVSFNYRIGIFGNVDFLDRLNDDRLKDSNSLTIEDQIKALKFIKDNISLFGGDPNNITLMGDSIGASYISILCTLDEIKGLFKRVFLISGSIYDMPFNSESSKIIGNAIIDKFNVKSIDDLRNISSKDLRNMYDNYYHFIEPTACGSKYIPLDIHNLLKNGKAKDIDFIIGFGSLEESGWEGMTAGDLDNKDMINSYYENFSNIIKKEDKEIFSNLVNSYKEKYKDEYIAKYKIISDLQFKASIISEASKLSKGGSNVYLFYLDVKPNIEKMGSSVVNIVSTILGNKEFAESMGYVIQDDKTEIFETLLHKFIYGENLELYNNEILGVDKIVWKKYDDETNSALHIQDKTIDNKENIFSDSIMTIKKLLD